MVDILLGPNQARAVTPLRTPDGDFDRPLGQPFSSAGTADAVPLSEAAAWGRICRTRLCADGICGGVGPDPGADRLSGGPGRRPKNPDHGTGARRRRADDARPALELSLADRLRCALGARQQRLPSGQLCDPFRPRGRSAHGPGVFDPHLRGLSRRCGGAAGDGGAGRHDRRSRRSDRRRGGWPAGRAAAARGRHSGCRRAKPRRRRQAPAADQRHDAGHHRADGLLHAAQPVQCRHWQFWRRRVDERLRPFIRYRQHRADGVSRRRSRRRAGRRLSGRPHQAPRPGCRGVFREPTPSSCWRLQPSRCRRCC